MSNELIVPSITVTTIPQGVFNVTPASPNIVVTGNVTVTNFPAVQPVSGTVSVIINPSLTATVTAVSVSTSATPLLVTNASRKGLAIQNTSGSVFIKLDSTVTTGLYSYELPRKGILEIEGYCGPVTAITSSGSVVVMVTEKV